MISADLLCPIDQPQQKSTHGSPTRRVHRHLTGSHRVHGRFLVRGSTRDERRRMFQCPLSTDSTGTKSESTAGQNHNPEKGDARTVFWTRSDVISLTKGAGEKLGYETRLGDRRERWTSRRHQSRMLVSS